MVRCVECGRAVEGKKKKKKRCVECGEQQQALSAWASLLPCDHKAKDRQAKRSLAKIQQQVDCLADELAVSKRNDSSLRKTVNNHTGVINGHAAILDRHSRSLNSGPASTQIDGLVRRVEALERVARSLNQQDTDAGAALRDLRDLQHRVEARATTAPLTSAQYLALELRRVAENLLRLRPPR